MRNRIGHWTSSGVSCLGHGRRRAQEAPWGGVSSSPSWEASSPRLSSLLDVCRESWTGVVMCGLVVGLSLIGKTLSVAALALALALAAAVSVKFVPKDSTIRPLPVVPIGDCDSWGSQSTPSDACTKSLSSSHATLSICLCYARRGKARWLPGKGCVRPAREHSNHVDGGRHRLLRKLRADSHVT